MSDRSLTGLNLCRLYPSPLLPARVESVDWCLLSFPSAYMCLPTAVIVWVQEVSPQRVRETIAASQNVEVNLSDFVVTCQTTSTTLNNAKEQSMAHGSGS